ncbi:MAG: putative blue copper protein [Acidimicrobiales bacterium]|nr:putative blue copper protein [Acidimicrobiales bacterium]
MSRISPSIVVCGLAAAFAATALVVNGDGSKPPAAPPAAEAPAAAGGGYGGGAPPGGAATAPSGATISIVNLSFSEAVTVRAGSQVTVDNQDSVAHTVTATNGAFDTGNVAPGTRTTLTAPATPGTYAYACSIHPQMTGEITVVP